MSNNERINNKKTNTEMKEQRYTIKEATSVFGEDAVKRLLAQDTVQTGRHLTDPEYKFDEYRGAKDVLTGMGLLRIYYNMPWDVDIFSGIDWSQYAEIVDLFY